MFAFSQVAHRALSMMILFTVLALMMFQKLIREDETKTIPPSIQHFPLSYPIKAMLG